MTALILTLLIAAAGMLLYVVKLLMAVPTDNTEDGEPFINNQFEEIPLRRPQQNAPIPVSYMPSPNQDYMQNRQRPSQQAPTQAEQEFHEVAGEVMKQIDDRIEKLQKLIEKADDKISTTPKSAGFVLPAELPQLQLHEQEPPAARNKPGQQFQPASRPSADPKDPRSKILPLHRSGLSSAEIARELKLGQGEVELIIRVNKYK